MTIRGAKVLLMLGCLAVCPLLARAAEEPTIDFNRDIRPILAKNCFACHGPDENDREAGLRLDQRAAVLTRLESGAVAVIPGKPEKSELFQRIASEDEFLRMPPPDAGKPLTPAEIELVKQWIAEGAEYAAHWSFVKPRRWELPEIERDAWPRNGIDYFILARLEAEGLAPSPEADRHTLIRRVSLDLRGLPPTPAEVEEFVNDPRPDAYEQLVDRFLCDQAYGERWARLWLDLARYADSKGYGSDPLREIWRYRDWVIDALNSNMPYDRFTIEQLAGDLLPDPTLEQRIATAFHRNTMTNTEGGTDDEEFRVEAVRDRVDTTMQVWMGLTMGCAKCHNHKYDPLTQREYYQFYAFFNQTADTDLPNESPTIPAPTPQMLREVEALDARIAELRMQLETSTPELADAQARWEQALQPTADWIALDLTAEKLPAGFALQSLEAGSVMILQTAKLKASLRSDPSHPEIAGDVANAGKSARSGQSDNARAPENAYVLTAQTDLPVITAFRLEVLPDAASPAGGSDLGTEGDFVLSRFSVTAEEAAASGKTPAGRFVRIEIPGANKLLSLAEVQVFRGDENMARGGKATQSSTAYDGPAERAIDGDTDGRYFDAMSTTHTATEKNPWWEVDLGKTQPVDRITVWNRTDGNLHTRLVDFRIALLDESRRTVWQQDVAEPPNPHATFAVSSERPVALARAFADYSAKGFPVAAALANKNRKQPGWSVRGRQDEPHAATFISSEPVRSSGTTQLRFRLDHAVTESAGTLGHFRLSVTSEKNVRRRLSIPPDVLAAVDQPSDQRTAEQREKIAAHYRTVAPLLKPVRDEIARLEKSRPEFPTVPVMQELPPDKRRKTHVMLKGNFLSLGEPVSPAVPALFHPFPEDAPLDRLGLAQWLVHEDNPLTARVAVNRFWARLFGIGLVETEEDFGTQGELPSHPKLLDWLATEFRRESWDMKAVLRLMVTSATYRQSSAITDEHLARDPRNRLLARAPRFRLEAEMVRDQALALSGLLSHKIHGPSVYPPQPPGLWRAAFNGRDRTWATSEGEDRYRRGLYTFWRRTVPYPSMATFDAPSREICSVRRIRTNTPLQAFVTLNDPVYVECAQALARRIVREGGASAAGRVRYGLRLCLVRPPLKEEVEPLVDLYESERQHYREHPEAAVKIATDPLGSLPEGMEAGELAAWTVVANVLLNLDGVLVQR